MIKYTLITPARNEEANLERTIKSVVAQSHLPDRWVIVDDGSTDNTGKIADQYADQYEWLEVVHRPEHIERSFAGKVYAFNAGLEKTADISFDVTGNLDADLSFEPDYLGFLMKKFEENPKLGVAGTPFTEDSGYDSGKDSFEGQNYVAGGCQLFRYSCFKEIGGYIPNPEGGVDWIAVMTARMKGWEVRSFQEKRFHHYRTLGTAEKGVLSALFDYGERAYFLGGSWVWQFFRVIYRMAKKPYIFGGLALGLGFLWAGVTRKKRPVSREMIRFNRKGQMKKLRTILGALIRFRKVDNFSMPLSQEETN